MATHTNQRPTQNPLEDRRGSGHSSTKPTDVDLYMPVDTSKMFGLTHNEDGTRVSRIVRALKVGFGQPSGPDIHVFIAPPEALRKWGKPLDAPWVIQLGRYDAQKKQRVVEYFFAADKNTAKQIYQEQRQNAPERKYPTKFPYFTFSRMGNSLHYEPDFDAIEKHGAVPRQVSIVFLKNDALQTAFEAWSAARLNCRGNGIDARRSIYWTPTDRDASLAAEAKKEGLKDFPVSRGCYTRGCPYARSEGDKPPLCKPHGRLVFQLENSPKIGEHCTFDTTGWRSTADLDTSLADIREVTGGIIAGIPLLLKLRPYKTTHNGKPTMQYGVTLEFLAQDAISLARRLNQYARDFRSATAQITDTPKQLEAPVLVVPEDATEEEFEDEPQRAHALAAEFYPETHAPEAGSFAFGEDALSEEEDILDGDPVEEEQPSPEIHEAEAVRLSDTTVGPFDLTRIPKEEIAWLLHHGRASRQVATEAQLLQMLTETTLTYGDFKKFIQQKKAAVTPVPASS